jgi:hypothetical protein
VKIQLKVVVMRCKVASSISDLRLLCFCFCSMRCSNAEAIKENHSTAAAVRAAVRSLPHVTHCS